MKKLLIALFCFSASLNAQAETSDQMFLPGQAPATADQPWKDQQNQRGIAKPESVPPTKGVIHVRRDLSLPSLLLSVANLFGWKQQTNQMTAGYSNYLDCYDTMRGQGYSPKDADKACDQEYLDVAMEEIDPEREYPILGKKGSAVAIDPEREFPILGKKGTMVAIDPEREYPILGKTGNVVKVDPMGVGPAKEAGVDYPDRYQNQQAQPGYGPYVEHPITGKHGTILKIDPVGVGPNKQPGVDTPETYQSQQAGTLIDPETEERPLPGKKGTMVAIDPEREYPILGKDKNVVQINPETDERPLPGQGSNLPGTIVKKDPLGAGPAKEEGVDFPNPNFMAAGPKDYDSGLPPGQVDLPKIEALRAMARTLADPNLKLHTVQLSAAAALSSAALIAYKMMGIGGRQRVLAALIPPQIVSDAVGRTGYRVPSDPSEVYTHEDAQEFAQMILAMDDQELNEFLSDVDPAIVEYSQIIELYVRQARGLEFQQNCPNPDLCS